MVSGPLCPRSPVTSSELSDVHRLTVERRQLELDVKNTLDWLAKTEQAASAWARKQTAELKVLETNSREYNVSVLCLI